MRVINKVRDYEKCILFTELLSSQLDEKGQSLSDIINNISDSYSFTNASLDEPIRLNVDGAHIDFDYMPANFMHNKAVGLFVRATAQAVGVTLIQSGYKCHENQDGDHSDCKDCQQASVDVMNVVVKDTKHLYHMWSYSRYVQNDVLMGENTAKSLLSSKFDHSTAYVRLPQKSMYFVFPQKIDEELSQYEGMYVNIDGNDLGDRIIRAYAPCRRTKKDKNVDPFDLAAFHFEIILKENASAYESLSDAIESSHGGYDSHDYVINDDMKGFNEYIENQKNVLWGFAHLIVQTCFLFYNSPLDDTYVEPKDVKVKPKKIKKHLDRVESKRGYYDLDSHYILINGKVGKASGSSLGYGNKIKKHFMVRSHYRTIRIKDVNKLDTINRIKGEKIIGTKIDPDTGEKIYIIKRLIDGFEKGKQYGELIEKDYKLTLHKGKNV
jgi:hypothetical protein